ncbi:MAG: hypothetical protein RIT81_17250 [Deltaproteobacteria bacterium]
MRWTICLAAGLLLSACGGAMEVDGIAFSVNDVVFSTWEEGGSGDNVVVVLSDAPDLCDGTGLEAGQSSLLIYRRWTGSAAMVLEQYDMTCALAQRDLSGQGWVSLGRQEAGSVDVDFVFPGPDGNMSGRVEARRCLGLDPKRVSDCDPAR